MRMRAEPAPALHDFSRRHATLVLGLLPRPPTNRKSSQPPDLGQPTLDRRHAEKHKYVGGLHVPSVGIPPWDACGWEKASRSLRGLRSCFSALSRFSHRQHVVHTRVLHGHKSKQLGAELTATQDTIAQLSHTHGTICAAQALFQITRNLLFHNLCHRGRPIRFVVAAPHPSYSSLSLFFGHTPGRASIPPSQPEAQRLRTSPKKGTKRHTRL